MEEKMDIINGSTVAIIKYCHEIALGMKKPHIYKEVLKFITSTPGQIRPVHYLLLLVEAKNSRKIDEALRLFPEAASQTRYILQQSAASGDVRKDIMWYLNKTPMLPNWLETFLSMLYGQKTQV